MKEKPDHADSTLSETMAARIEIKDLGDPSRQKEITDLANLFSHRVAVR
jgi:hypothetical protein